MFSAWRSTCQMYYNKLLCHEEEESVSPTLWGLHQLLLQGPAPCEFLSFLSVCFWFHHSSRHLARTVPLFFLLSCICSWPVWSTLHAVVLGPALSSAVQMCNILKNLNMMTFQFGTMQSALIIGSPAFNNRRPSTSKL